MHEKSTRDFLVLSASAHRSNLLSIKKLYVNRKNKMLMLQRTARALQRPSTSFAAPTLARATTSANTALSQAQAHRSSCAGGCGCAHTAGCRCVSCVFGKAVRNYSSSGGKPPPPPGPPPPAPPPADVRPLGSSARSGRIHPLPEQS